MSERITVDLPDDLYRRAEIWASHTGKSVVEVVAEAVRLSLAPLGERFPPTDSLTDEEVLSLGNLEMPELQDRRLSELLALQQAQGLSPTEANELRVLMQTYNEGLLRKSEALKEAVRRGLRAPVSS